MYVHVYGSDESFRDWTVFFFIGVKNYSGVSKNEDVNFSKPVPIQNLFPLCFQGVTSNIRFDSQNPP